MSRNSTSSSPARGRSRQIETRYEKCPLCSSRNIHIGRERLSVSGPNGQDVSLNVRRWKCENCGESFLTADSRRELDELLHGTSTGR